jgi:dsRNA-specific ribonuclease
MSSAIFHGDRAELFRKTIRNVLEKGRLKPHYIDILLSDEGIELYSQVFTHDSADPTSNYQYYETLGDVTANKIIVWYFTRRYPQLHCIEGVKIVSRLKINYGSKSSFAPIAEKLGFWDLISAAVNERSSRKKALLEDSLEAFIGATEFFLDHKVRAGVGYVIVYEILAAVFDDMEISLRYEDLFDSKTRVKEIFDYFKLGRNRMPPIGKESYKHERDNDMYNVHLFRVLPTGAEELLGVGTAPTLADAQQRAAERAHVRLNQMGYVRPVPEDYQFFCPK